MCATSLADALLNITYYPHPFTTGGFVVILDSEAINFLEMSGVVYAHLPSGYAVHVLRENELDLLSAPGMFAPPLHINEKPHLPFYLRYRGVCLYGRNYCEEILLPDTTYLLKSHIEGCFDYLRRYGIVSSMINQKFHALVALLENETSLLIATAVLTKGQWEVDLAALSETFFAHFKEPAIHRAYTDFNSCTFAEDDEITATEMAEKVYLFESFLHQLKEVA